MKTRLITFCSILLLAAIGSQDMSAQLAKGRKSLGVKTGYITLNKTATAGIELQYAFSRHFVLAPSIDYVFRNESMDGLMINLDYHGPWQLDPAAGMTGTDINDDVTTRVNRVGLNFGAGIDYYVSPTLKLSLQGKFNWIKDHNTGLFNLGISYVF